MEVIREGGSPSAACGEGSQHGFRFIAQGHYDLRRACSDLGVELM